MSLSEYICPLKCTGCGQVFPFPAGANRYTDFTPPNYAQTSNPDKEITRVKSPKDWVMPQLPVWCLHCDGPSYVERVPSEREFAHATGLRRKNAKFSEHGVEDPLLYLDEDDFQLLYEQCLRRSSTPKCVLCGSSAYIELSASRTETGLKHEACWGSPIRFPGYRIMSGTGSAPGNFRLFDKDGELAWSTIYKTKMPSFSLQAVIHIPRTSNNYAALRRILNTLMHWRKEGEAIALLQPLYEQRDATAVGIMGALHYLGLGVEHDGTRAKILFQEAMTSGDLAAHHNLASLHATGAPGVLQDNEAALALHHHACSVGASFAGESWFANPDARYARFRTDPRPR